MDTINTALTERLLSNEANLVASPYGVNQPNTEDLHENANQVEPMPIAPPVTQMDRVAGYDNVQFGNCKSMYMVWLVTE